MGNKVKSLQIIGISQGLCHNDGNVYQQSPFLWMVRNTSAEFEYGASSLLTPRLRTLCSRMCVGVSELSDVSDVTIHIDMSRDDMIICYLCSVVPVFRFLEGGPRYGSRHLVSVQI